MCWIYVRVCGLYVAEYETFVLLSFAAYRSLPAERQLSHSQPNNVYDDQMHPSIALSYSRMHERCALL